MLGIFQVIAKDEQSPAGPVDWGKLRAEITARLDVVREFADLGVEFTGRHWTDAQGSEHHECFGPDREIKGVSQPSAVVYTGSGLLHDSGTGQQAIHLIDYALKVGKFGRFIDTIRHYAGVAGVSMPSFKASKGGRLLERTYDYTDLDGVTRYRVFRYIQPNGSKTFTQHPIRNGQVVFDQGAMSSVAPLPYRLRELPCVLADASEPGANDSVNFVYLCEGEKAADAVRLLGLTASTAHGGSGGARKIWPVIASYFRGLDCVFLPDNDKAGREVAVIACQSLRDAGAASVRSLTLPGLPIKGDCVDWIGDGGTREQLEALADACPLWTEEAAEAVAGKPDPPGLPDDFPADEDVELVMMDTVQPVAVRWLWPDVIPLGKLTQFGGEPKMGKSFLTTWLAATVTTGGEIPGRVGECMPQGSVILLSAEDDQADTIRPRLDACRADCSKVGVINTVRLPSGKFGPFTLAYIQHLERAIIRLGDVLLVIIDPITHYATAGHDDHKATQVRQLLEPLRALAEKYDFAVVFVHHFNKGNGTRALNRFSGSGAYGALARSNWVIIRDQDDPKRRLFLSAGCNLVEEPNGLAYRIDREQKCVVFEAEPLTITADDALAASMERSEPAAGAKAPTKLDECVAWLRERLSKTHGTALVHVLRDEAEEAGYVPDTLYKAEKRLRLLKSTNVQNKKVWTMPEEPAVLPIKSRDSETTIQ